MTKRRQRGEGGLYQRGDGMWVGVVDLGWVNGKRTRKTVSSKSQMVAHRKLTALKRTLADTGAAPDAQMTVERWLEHWLADIASPRTKPRTMQGYRTTVRQHLLPHLGKRRLDQLAQQHVRAMHRALEDQGLAAGTILKAHRVLAKALTDAVREGRAVRNVATLVDAPRRSVTNRGSLTAEQARQILLHPDPMRTRWGAALLIGARQGEALGLEWDRVNLHEGWVDLSWQLQRLGYVKGTKRLDVPAGFEHQQIDGGLCLTRPKSRSGQRVIPLPPPMAWLLEQTPYPLRTGLVFTRPGGRPIDPSQDNKAWHAMLDDVGLPSVPLHAARHTTASLLLQIGVDPEVIKAILGHSSIVATRAYMHTSRTLTTDAMRRYGEFLALDPVKDPGQDGNGKGGHQPDLDG